VRFGRPAKLEADQVALAQRLMGEGTPARAIAASSDDASQLIRA
jgi:hypothetical protein